MTETAQSNSSSESCPQCALRRAKAGSGRHWLLDAVYGRDLLKQRLRQVRPDLLVPVWDDAPELDPLLDSVIDDLGLRDWPEPRGLKARCRYLKTVGAMMIAIRNNRELPAW